MQINRKAQVQLGNPTVAKLNIIYYNIDTRMLVMGTNIQKIIFKNIKIIRKMSY